MLKLEIRKLSKQENIESELAEYIMCCIWDKISFLLWRGVNRQIKQELENSINSLE